MPRRSSQPLYIAIGGHAVALDPTTGTELWRTKVKATASIMTLAMQDGQLLVGAGGELFCLDPRTGEILWHNKLKGLGLGLVAFVGTDVAASLALRNQQAAATAAV